MSRAVIQIAPLGHHPEPRDLMQQALAKCETATDLEKVAGVLEKLVALEQTNQRFLWEREERQMKVDFDDALMSCQEQIGRIEPNQKRGDTGATWADYLQLDKAIRPVYIKAGFSISYSQIECPVLGKIRVQATLSRSGISRQFVQDLTPPMANKAMTQTDTEAAANSRAKRYLLLAIFNIAVGIDKEEKQGIPVSERDEAELQTWADALSQAPDLPQLKSVFADAYKFAKRIGEPQKVAMMQVYEDCKRRLL